MAKYTTPAWTNGAAPALNAANMLALGQSAELGEHPYGVCSTAAATAAKAVTIDFSGTLALFTGLTVRVKFSNSNSAANPTLNVNSTGAKSIMSYGTTPATTWLAGQTITFVYDGTNWLMTGFDAYTKGQALSSATASAMNTQFGNTPATPDAALGLLTAAFSGVARIATGTYIGTGVHGQSNQNSITFPFEPLIVAVYGKNSAGNIVPPSPGYSTTSNGWSDSLVWMRNGETVTCWLFAPSTGYYYVITQFTSVSGKTFSWYIKYMPSGVYDASLQLNGSGNTYQYLAIGV